MKNIKTFLYKILNIVTLSFLFKKKKKSKSQSDDIYPLY